MRQPRWKTPEVCRTPHRIVGAIVALVAVGISGPMVLAAPEVPFLVSAYDAAEKKPSNPGISATVTMTTLGAASKPPKVLIAQGPLAMEGDLLGGRLPMTFDNASAVASGDHSLYFTVSKTGRIGLQWLVDDKPRDGISMQAFDTDVAGGTLTKKLTWNGAYRLVTVSVERKISLIGSPIVIKPKRPIIVGGVIKFRPTPTPKPTFKPIIVGTIKLPPKGRKVRVTARFVVTNSDDGLGGVFGTGDKKVELAGSITMGGQSAFKFSNRPAVDGNEFQSKAMDDVTLTYSDPDYRFFKVEGKIYDLDQASNADTLWVANERVDLIKIMESNQEYRIRGDRNSESGDLYIRVVDQGEFR
jgi:hypothetical protein